jgi:hypothetical protein
MKFSRCSVVFTERYQRVVADYFCTGHFCRYTMITARERKPKRGACLGGHWEMIILVARALGPYFPRLWLL